MPFMSVRPVPLLTIEATPGDRPVLSSPDQRARLPVLLVSMPFMEFDRPSIQLGLLKAIATAHGFPARTFHANLDFAARIGLETYRRLSEQRGAMVGDWLFSLEAFGEAAPDPEDRLLDDLSPQLSYLSELVYARSELHRFVRVHRPDLRDRLGDLRREAVPAYLDQLVDDLDLAGVRVVGFTSTFQQNAASFALARRVKRRHPGITTVFGGANFDGEMGLELVRAVDCIDFAVIGEAETTFPSLLDALAAGADAGQVPGIARRVDGDVTFRAARPLTVRLDDQPVPDYGEYFEHAEALDLIPRVGHRNVWIPFESARGCWWGAKHHCTFCGLNGTSMQFRSKSPHRVADELAELTRRHGSFMYEAVDNILDPRYLKELLPALTESRADYEIFYEVKANLTRSQLRLLAQAGVTRIQPGLESLSTHVLQLMRKGVRAAQNVNLLRWAQYYGIHVAWNILWGFPGETEQDYVQQADVVPHLLHLRPPNSAARIWLERFSPLFTDAEPGRFASRSPNVSYAYVYPADFDLERLAYFFEYELRDCLPDACYDGLHKQIERWAEAWESDTPPTLTFWSSPSYLHIYDEREVAAAGTYTFHGAVADIYSACSDRPTTAKAVRDNLGLRYTAADVQEVFAEFQARGLMFVDGDLAVALALPATRGR
jgi:ribosomal peptide maturation radical SAM protein 1